MKPKLTLASERSSDSVRAMPSARVLTLRAGPISVVPSLRASPAIAERVFGSETFIKRTRDPALPRPARFEPTVKGENDVVI